MTDAVSAAPSRRQFIEATVGLGLATALAGCGDGGDGDGATPTPTPEPQLEVSRIQFVASQPTGYGEYDPVQDKTYQLGGQAWVYFEPEGVTSEAEGDGKRIELTLEAEFTDAEGRVVNTVGRTLDRNVEAGQSLDELFLFATTELPQDAAVGTWQVEVELTDELSGATTTFTREFEVEAGEPTGYIGDYGSALRAETDISVQSLESVDGEVVLEYESTYETDTSPWREEVGAVAGIFVRFVDDGWQAERLSATTTGAGGRTVTWHLSRETALAFIAGEITSTEFGERILDTMEAQ